MILDLPEMITLNEYINKERSNRYIAAKVKSKLTLMVVWECKVKKIKPVKSISKLTFIWKEKTKRRDPDNISFGQKMILDGLVEAGVFPTDGWKLWKNNPLIIHKFEKAGHNSVIVLWK
jgi:Holliday junction resolvase RusA-like endonuclease